MICIYDLYVHVVQFKIWFAQKYNLIPGKFIIRQSFCMCVCEGLFYSSLFNYTNCFYKINVWMIPTMRNVYERSSYVLQRVSRPAWNHRKMGRNYVFNLYNYSLGTCLKRNLLRLVLYYIININGFKVNIILFVLCFFIININLIANCMCLAVPANTSGCIWS